VLESAAYTPTPPNYNTLEKLLKICVPYIHFYKIKMQNSMFFIDCSDDKMKKGTKNG
jgi:hypothetical protein